MTVSLPLSTRYLITFLIATGGGFIADAMHLPLGWLVGSLAAVAAANLLWGPSPVPGWARQVGQVTAGIAVGLSFTPATAARLINLCGYMLLAAVLSIVAGIILSNVLEKTTGVSRSTAYFASMPGGVAEMSVLADRYGGDTALVALSQSLRVVMVVLFIPAMAAAFGWHGTIEIAASPLPLLPVRLAAMLVAGMGVAWACGKVGLSNNWLLGGLIMGCTIGYWGLPASRIPVPVIDASQILIGSALGARFSRAHVLKFRRFVPATIVSTAVLIILTTALAAMISHWSSVDWATLTLATAPGGVAEMSLTARTLHLGAPEVTAFHLVRIVLVILASAPLYAWTGRGRMVENRL